MKTYKLQELQGRYFVTVPSEYVRELNLNKGDKIRFSMEGSNMIMTKETTKDAPSETTMPEMPQQDAIQSQERAEN